MDNQDIIVTHHAILIGIDAYPDRPLTSCVNDIQEIKNYLERVLNSVHIQMFRAPKSTNLESDNPVKGSVLWPTFDNVISAFKETTSRAKAGDFVYIHYSGHGTRPPAEPREEFSNMFTGNLALVLLDEEEENGLRYLLGWVLAHWLKAMVDKGLVVTLVLDCCFSATVYRDDDPTIRFLPYDAEIDSKDPLSLAKSPEFGADRPANRDASMQLNWLINPDGYAILVACGPDEFARGLTANGQNHGALSYFLLKTFTDGGLREKHMNIYHHLCARFRKSRQQQNPVLYGNGDQGFFGNISSGSHTNPIAIVERDHRDGNLQLQAGQAHGVCDNDRFTLRPLGSNGEPVIAEVTHTRALTSDLKLSNTTSVCDRTGWIAEPYTRASYGQFPIQLASSLPRQDEWLAALKTRSLDAHIDIDEHPYALQVLLNSCMEYEILDNPDHKIINHPTMSHDQTDVSSICDILEHLVRYKLVRTLANEILANDFMESFKVQIISRSGEIFDQECVVEVEQGEDGKFMFELQVENKGSQNLYVFVYDMGPCWQVQNILRASYEVIPPQNSGKGFRGMFRKKLRTIVPPEMREKGDLQCQDIIKVFVTSKPTSFDLLELPKLGESAKEYTTSNRTGREDSDVPEEWAALNFPIHTFLK